MIIYQLANIQGKEECLTRESDALQKQIWKKMPEAVYSRKYEEKNRSSFSFRMETGILRALFHIET